MKQPVVFKPKFFIAMLLVCAIGASAIAWVTGLSFWILAAILVVGVLVNGLVASFEGKGAPRK